MTATQINSMSYQHEGVRQIIITLRHNTVTQHWSVEIDGERYEHVTTDFIEALVECQLIVAEKSLTDLHCLKPRVAATQRAV